MQVQNINQQPLNQPASPQRGLVAGCCLFALMIGLIGSGRASEPRQPLTAVLPATSVAPSAPTSLAIASVHVAEPAPFITEAKPDPAKAGEIAGTAIAADQPHPASATGATDKDASGMTMAIYLDRLMKAESGGKLTARSSTSTALGPFQFIDATFLRVARGNFPTETAALKPSQVLGLRTNLEFSRRVAEAYTNENATSLTGAGIAATYTNLRLAYLLGPAGAIKILQADPAMPLAQLLSPSVIHANPFMRSLTAAGLAARAAREIAVSPTSMAGVSMAGIPAKPAVAKPAATTLAGVATALPAPTTNTAIAKAPAATGKVIVSCDLGLASCRRWLALEQRKTGNRPRPMREASVR
jgi:hypothetical protein